MSAYCSGIGDLLSVICLTLACLFGAVDVHDLYLLVAVPIRLEGNPRPIWGPGSSETTFPTLDPSAKDANHRQN